MPVKSFSAPPPDQHQDAAGDHGISFVKLQFGDPGVVQVEQEG
ncbi:MAG: hypothetical protein ABFS17_07600 [Chloroflexota bacterium]